MKTAKLIKVFKKKLKILFTRLLAKILLPCPSDQFSPKKVRKILVYGSMGIGNLIMFTPALKAIRNKFPNSHIALLADIRWNADEIVSESPLINEIVINKPGDYWELLKLSRYVKSQKFDLLLSTIHGNENHLPQLTVLSGIPYRAGHCTSPGWKNKYDFLYNIPVYMQENEHEVERGLHLAGSVGCDTSDKQLYLHIDEEAEKFSGIFFKDNGISEEDFVLGVQIGSSAHQSWKQWDPKNLGIVCEKLMTVHNFKIIFLGASQDRDQLDQILNSMCCKPIIALGKTSVKQVAAIIKKCDGTLCNDSGLMHVSMAVGSPTVAIIGPTDIRRTGPYGKGYIIVRKNLPCSPCFTLSEINTAKSVMNCPHHNCLNLITVQEVLNAVDQIRKKSQR